MKRVFEGKSREELLALARSYKWWHAIDLGELVTDGVVGRRPLIDRAFGQIDFTGKKVLDIGCWDGLWSFEAEKRGAREVHSVDYVSLRSWSEQPTYQLAHLLLGSRNRYYPNTSVYDVGRLGVADFDVVIYTGIYYHLLEPLRAFAALRDVMAPGGVMVVEGPVLDGTNRVFSDFYARTWFADDPSNWWIPSMACLREWLDCSFFDVVAEWSNNRNFEPPPPALPPPPPPSSTTPPDAALAEVPPPPVEVEDRVSVVARATSIAERLARRVRRQNLPSLSSTPGVTREATAALADAFAQFQAARPWEAVPHDRLIKLECAQLGGEAACVLLLGSRSAEHGVIIFFQRPTATLMLQGSLLGEMITWPGFLAAFSSGSDGSQSGEAEAVFNGGHAYAANPANTLRRPQVGELLLLEGCLRAVPQLVARQPGPAGAGQEMAVSVAAGVIQMTLSWVTEGEREL